ncbi:hypothetical protein AB0N17_12980 [Streptomyces sp. NPDC051133]|uniref:hypothetical protein n=1 Tax=Streptomyces sp. NPDC051133 TaxID=3155521 RepID=UPI00341F2410
MIDEPAVEIWNDELEELFLRTGHRFRRVEPRRRMRDYIGGLLCPVARKNGLQLAEDDTAYPTASSGSPTAPAGHR